MCGIAVILPNSALEVAPWTIDRMTAALAHRGPDARATQRLKGCYLGHTRLAILDPEGGAQPMGDEGGRHWIVFNGEIFNHPALRRALESFGHVFRTRSDTEVLLRAYMQWGRSCVGRLNGQFAFAVWDQVEQTLFAARDRFGEKPFHYALTPEGHWLAASEIKSLLASDLINPHIDLLSVDAVLSLFYVPPDRTIYQDVFTLPPAHAAIFRPQGRMECWRYWEPVFSNRSISESEAVEGIRTLVQQAVRRQKVADVPVGCFLSGGLDSTTIAGELAGMSGRPVRTYAVGFGDLINELPFAREAAEAYGTEHRELEMDIDVAAALEQMLEVYDEPFADSSNIPTWHVCRFARQEVKVALSGDGGDELFGGYDWYTPLLQPEAELSQADVWQRHTQSSTHLHADRGSLWGHRPQPATAAIVRDRFGPNDQTIGIDRAIAFDLGCYLPGDILVKMDRAAMAHGLETRAPFLDVDLVEFILSLPHEMRFKGGRLKHLMRQAFSDRWPASIRSRGKQGFGAPVYHWMRQPPVAAMWDRIRLAGSALCELLPGTPTVAQTLRPQRQWTLLCLGLWLERHSSCLRNLW
ncbi:MAG: asparagine synthase (glutamine-hydrolyzing) [Phycisphaerales bacterium]|nr:asparagine synthase (glutamine-hydrolyzing) [Phycisphaerales bacterium]